MVFICRLCGKCENDSLGLSIFGEQGLKEALAYKIKLSLDISVFEYDPLPKYICECCLGKLITTFTFQESCRRVQILLREHFLSSKTWPLNATTSTAEVEQLPIESIRETSVQKSTLHILHDTSYFQGSGTARSQNEINEICIEENHGNLTPSDLRNLQTQPSFVSAESPAGNIQTVENSRPQLEQPRAETEITVCGEPFTFRTLLRNGVIEELVQAVGNKGSKKPNTRKTRKPPSNVSTRKKHKTTSGLEPPAPITESTIAIQGSNMVSANLNMSVGQEAVNKPVSSGIGNHRSSEVRNSRTNTSVGSSPERVEFEEVDVKPDIYVAAGANETPQIVALVNTQDCTPSSQPEESGSESRNTLKIVDVFSGHEISSTSMPEFVTSKLPGSSTQSWHCPSATADQSNSNPSSTCSNQSSFKNPSTIRNWHTPVPVNNPQKTSKEKEKVVDSGSALNVSLPEDEDEVFVVEIVKANKDSIAQHWDRCPSGFICKLCNKQYKRLIKCENHIRIHLGVKPYECKTCKRRYLKRRLLNEHCSFHMGKKLYQCKICDKSFRYRKSFKIHAASHVEELNSSYLCEICNKTFESQFDYWNHKASKHIIVESQMRNHK